MSGVAADPIRMLIESVRKYSPSGEEAEIARFFSDQMKAAGYSKVRIDAAGNAVGEVGTGKIRVLLCGHIDTVPGEIAVSLRGDILRGRGAADAKAPMCAMIGAASRFVGDSGLHLTVVCATGEEGDSRGIKQVLKGPAKYDFAVFGEPGGATRVTVGYRGRVALHVQLSTAGGHAGSAWAHDSAFDRAVALASVLRSLDQKISEREDRFHSVSVTITRFEAGEYQNIVPSGAKFTCDVRVPAGRTCAEVERELTKMIADFSKRTGVKVNSEFEEATEPYESASSSTLVRGFQRAVLLAGKSKPVLLKKTGTGDMNTFASEVGAQCVTYGPGDSRLSHTANESVSIKDYLLSIEVLAEALNQLKVLNRSR
jgi:[amino group carrier protein]-lysine/ornithine hydrolase